MKKILNIKYSIAGAVALITFIVYLPSLADNFVMWDDSAYVVTNPHIRSFNLAFFRWAFFDFYASNWHPLTWISHALDYAVWGLNPLGHHLTNIMLHAVNAFILVLLAMRLLQAGKEETAQTGFPGFMNERGILIAAGATGLLFGLHPVHVESVAWVAERKDLLCALFFLLSIITYTDYAGSAQEGTSRKNPFLLFLNKRYVFTIGFFVLALLSKPMAVTLPVVLLILDWRPFNRIRSLKTFLFALAEKIPFFLLSLISSIITILAQQKAMMLRGINAPLSARPLVAAHALVRYLGKLIWPVDLAPYYPYPNEVSLFSFKYLSALALVAGITLACIAAAKKRKIWLAAWGYFIVTLVPVIGLVQVGGQAMADRYMYLPSLGPFLIVGLGVAWISAKAFSVDKPSSFAQLLSAATAMVVLFTMTYLTSGQISIWKDRLILWTYVVEKEPASPFTHNNLGMAYDDKGMTDQAIEQYRIALLLDPTQAMSYNNLGAAFKKQGSIDKAIERYQIALGLEPDNSHFHNNLGVAYQDKGLKDQAIEQYQIALRLDPENDLAHSNLGEVYAQKGFLDEAISHFLIAVRLNPDYAPAHYTLAEIYMQKGLIDPAIEHYRIVLMLFPNNVHVHTNLGLAYLKKGQGDEAIRQFSLAAALQPGSPMAHSNLGAAYGKFGFIDKAVEQFKIAVKMDPKNLNYRRNLAMAVKRMNSSR